MTRQDPVMKCHGHVKLNNYNIIKKNYVLGLLLQKINHYGWMLFSPAPNIPSLPDLLFLFFYEINLFKKLLKNFILKLSCQ